VYISDKSKSLLGEIRSYGTMEPRQFVIDLEACEGMYLATIDGQKIFDWTNYYASKLIAHNHQALYDPEYVKRLVRAANNKVSNPDFVTMELIEYYRLLHRIAPKCMRSESGKFEGQVYTVNSGAEAMENAMKYLVSLHSIKNEQDVQKSDAPCFIFFQNGFHGRTVYTLNVSDMPHNQVAVNNYHGLTVKNIMMPFPAVNNDNSKKWNLALKNECLTKLSDALTHSGFNVAGIVVEPMQGTGGHRVAVDGFFRELSILAHTHGVPLCFDEVQTAGGPTGEVFMSDQLNLVFPPKAIATAKKFGCGVVYLHEHVKEEDWLDSTWSGHLADMVRFVKEWSIVESEQLIERSRVTAQALKSGLNELVKKHNDHMCNVRGLGLYQGFSFTDAQKKHKFIDIALEKHNTLLMSAGTHSLRLRPHLSVEERDVKKLLYILDDIASDL
jgi:L-lysine 6-transaminase